MSDDPKGSNTTVITQGMAVLWQRPQTLLMQFAIVTKGDTIDEALADIGGRTRRAQQRLQQANATHVEIDEPFLGEPNAADLTSPTAIAKRMRERMARAQSMGRAMSATPEDDGMVTVSNRISAKWSLEIESPDDSLRFVDQLRRGLADIGGVRPTDISDFPAYPTEPEQIAALTAGVGEPEYDPSQPQFFYIATLGEAEQQQLYAAALANGKQQAEQIARASGKQLGELKSIHAMHAANYDPMMHQAKMQQQMQGREWPDEDGVGFVLISDTNRKAKFGITLMQTYDVC